MNDYSDKQFNIEKLMIHQRFVIQLQKLLDEKNEKPKDLAKKINVSKSYISQIFHGNKMVNIDLLAKVMLAYDMKFEALFSERKPVNQCKFVTWQVNTLNYDQRINHTLDSDTVFSRQEKKLPVKTGTI